MTLLNGIPGFFGWGYTGSKNPSWYTDYRTHEDRLKAMAQILQRSVAWNGLMGDKINEVVETVNTLSTSVGSGTGGGGAGGGTTLVSDGLGVVIGNHYLPLNGASRYNFSADPMLHVSVAARTELPETGDFNTIYTVTENFQTLAFVWRAVESFPQWAVDDNTWATVTGGRYFPILLGNENRSIDMTNIHYYWDGDSSFSSKKITYDTRGTVFVSSASPNGEFSIPAAALGDASSMNSLSANFYDIRLNLADTSETFIINNYVRTQMRYDPGSSTFKVKIQVDADLLSAQTDSEMSVVVKLKVKF